MTTDSVARFDATHLFRLDRGDPAQLRRFYDESHVLAALQGIVNRAGPHLYLRYNATQDDFWWARLREPNPWQDTRRVEELSDLDALLARFRSSYNGLVVWDERVPATSNIASTLAGVDDLLPVRYDATPGSLYQRLTSAPHALPVRRRLIGKDGSPLFTGGGTIPGTSLPTTWSAKNDAYRWMIETVLRRGDANPRVMGYYVDAWWLNAAHVGWPINHTLTNHDYVISHRGIVWDLNVWPDEACVDDPGQKPGTDRATLEMLLAAANERLAPGEMIHVAGYTPWRTKYTDVVTNGFCAGGKRDGVATEWLTTEVLTSWNAYLDADALDYAAMVNASFWQHIPAPAWKQPANPAWRLPDVVPQKSPPVTDDWLGAQGFLDDAGAVVSRHYYAHYAGDYDAAAWLYWNLPEFWTDERRGELPLSWAFNPNLAERFAFGMAWAREHATPNDVFVAGDSGAGYVNPYHLSEPRALSGLPSGWAAWETHCACWMRQWDLDVVGFVLDGNTPNMGDEGFAAYARFAPGGIVMHRTNGPATGVREGIAFATMAGDLPWDVDDAARELNRHLKPGGPHFTVHRCVLRSPTWYAELEERAGALRRESSPDVDARLVSLPVLLGLVRRASVKTVTH